MHCFACDLDLSETTTPDRPTGRYYCSGCFELTLEVQLVANSRDIEWARLTETKFSQQDIVVVSEEVDIISECDLYIESEDQEETEE